MKKPVKTKFDNLPFLGFEDTMTALGCSKSFLQSLVSDGLITPKYLKRKPYFFIEDIINAMTKKA